MGSIFLVRHARAAPPGILAGRRDYALTAQGRMEAEALRRRLDGQVFSLVFSSPLRRCLETASILLCAAQNAPAPQLCPELAELSLGLREGRDKGWIMRRYPEVWAARGLDPAGCPPPEGESLKELAARVLPAFERIKAAARAADGNTLVVGHQAVNRVILAKERGIGLERALDIEQPPCALTRLEL